MNAWPCCPAWEHLPVEWRMNRDGYMCIIEGDDRSFESHVKLREKYQGVARYPWLPVKPDPRQPK